jgi:uncharacterized membrane protein YfcA
LNRRRFGTTDVPLVGIGIVAGLFSGLFGVGGGIVMVPLLVLAAALPQHLAHATSLAAILPIAAVAATRFGIDSEVNYGVAALLAAGSLLGAPLGARLMTRLSEGFLKIAFGALMIAVGISLVID